MKIRRREILDKAVHDCYKEMYAKAQPSADWDQIIKEYEEGEREKDERVYEQHYLSQEEYSYIVDKYVDAYGIRARWEEYVGVVEDYLNKGGTKDKYIEDKYDENGELIESGYRGYEKVAPVKEQIRDILYKYIDTDGHADEATDKVVEAINARRAKGKN